MLLRWNEVLDECHFEEWFGDTVAFIRIYDPDEWFELAEDLEAPPILLADVKSGKDLERYLNDRDDFYMSKFRNTVQPGDRLHGVANSRPHPTGKPSVATSHVPHHSSFIPSSSCLTYCPTGADVGLMKFFPMLSLLSLVAAPILSAQETPAKPAEAAKPGEASPVKDREKAKEADKDKEKEKDKDAKKEGGDRKSETAGKVLIAGTELAYDAVAGTLALKKADGATRANVFYVSYTMKGLDETQRKARPVTFCFNGGPGSSAVWLHLGAFGPKRVLLEASGTAAPKPPFQMVANEHCLLDTTDLVFIDPVSTGYSRAEKGEEPKQFHGFTEDIESVGDFIRSYVSKHERWTSPKFLMGESYGAIRGGGLANHLQSRYGMYLNGLVIVSGVFDFQTLDGDGTNDLSRICFLPSLAAVAHFHKKLSPERQADLPGLIKAAELFSQTTYATALLRGTAMPPEERKKVAEEFASLIGLPADLILRENMRISPGLFFEELLKSEDKVVGRFDARVVGAPGGGDPSYDLVYGAYAGCFNSYVREELKFEEERPYEILSRAVQPWNYSQFTNGYVSVADSLESALKANPAFSIYIACGYRDLATPYRGITHTVDHLDVEPKLRSNIQFGYYDAGHMMYTNLPDLQKLASEVRMFIQKKK